MILKEYQLDDVIKKKSLPQFLLIYGPNEGLVREDVQKISKAFMNKAETDEISINGKDLDENQSLIDQEVRSFSMFSEKKIIYLEHVKDRHLQCFEGQELNNNVVIIITDWCCRRCIYKFIIIIKRNFQ